MNDSFTQQNDLKPERQNFVDCLVQHVPGITRVVRALMRGDQSAEDVVQQTVIKALTNADQFHFHSALKTWLISIAINEVRQTYRSGWRKRAVPLKPETINVLRVQDVGLPHNDYEANERNLPLRDAVSHLPWMYRSVVELCDFECVPSKEAARRLRITLPALKSRRHRAHQKLLPLLLQTERKTRMRITNGNPTVLSAHPTDAVVPNRFLCPDTH
jgi:RNA polymerase sigma-70 factor (ECF subfamily)